MSPFLEEDLRRLARAERRGRVLAMLRRLAWPAAVALFGLAGAAAAGLAIAVFGGSR